MRRFCRSALCLVLLLGMLLGFCPAPAHADNTVHTLELPVTYHQTEARRMLKMINDFRTGDEAYYLAEDNTTIVSKVGKLGTLSYSESLEKTAMQRAAEIAVSFAHARPDGTMCFSAFPAGCYTAGENIAAGYGSAESAFVGWREDDCDYQGQGHRRNMLSESFNSVGIGCVAYNGWLYWVQDFGYYSDSAGSASDGDRTVEIRLSEAWILDLTDAEAVPTQLTIKPGAKTDTPRVSGTMHIQNHWPSGAISGVMTADWTSGNEKIAKVEDGALIAVAVGETTLSTTIAGTTVSLPLTVSKDAPVAPPSKGIPIDEARFPDPNFRALVSEIADTNGDKALNDAELAALKTLDCKGKSIGSLQGLELFTALTALDCSENSLTALDLSSLVSLSTVNCSYNSLTALNVRGCKALKELDLSFNSIEELNLTGCIGLENIDAQSNAIHSLTMDGRASLKKLNLFGNRLTELDLTGFGKLETLVCAANELASLKLSDCGSLSSLNCMYNSLSELDLSESPLLDSLYCRGNKLTKVCVHPDAPLTTLMIDESTELVRGTPGEQQKPAAPGVTGKLSSGKPKLTWQAVPDAAEYQIYRSTTGKAGSFKLVKTTTGTSWRHAKAGAGKTYYYKVCAVTADGLKGEFSETVTLTAKPAAPKVSGTITAKGKPTLSWKSVTGAVKYQVYRSTMGKSGSFKLLKTVTGLKATNTKATAGKTYYFKVRAVAADGTKGTFSSVVKITAGKPVIKTQPKNVTAKKGSTATIKVKATGEGLSYQWQYRTSASGKWKKATAEGNQTATLKVPVTAKKNGWQYRCVIKNAAGKVTTKAVTLKVAAKPAITTQPKNVTVAKGGTAKFTVKATGADLSYQWQYRTSASGKWKNCTDKTPGYHSATLKVSATAKRNGWQYRCVITNAAGKVTTKAVTLKVK